MWFYWYIKTGWTHHKYFIAWIVQAKKKKKKKKKYTIFSFPSYVWKHVRYPALISRQPGVITQFW